MNKNVILLFNISVAIPRFADFPNSNIIFQWNDNNPFRYSEITIVITNIITHCQISIEKMIDIENRK